jgi:hypothetical protein
MLDYYGVEAEFHQEVPTKYGVAYRVKVLVKDHGFYINGMMVYPPNVDHPEWGVNPPGMPRQPGKFVVEFMKKHPDYPDDEGAKHPLWEEVERQCLEVAQAHHMDKEVPASDKSTKAPFKKDVVIEDFDVNAPITLDDIPF